MLTVVLFALSTGLAAQTQFSGVVRDEQGLLPGVSVQNLRTGEGTATRLDGRFEIAGAVGDSLSFSFVGLATAFRVLKAGLLLEVVMKPDAEQFGEAVVTALGIEKEKKALGYSVGEVDVASAQTNRDANLVNTMQGKIAGVVVTKTSGGPGSSSRIVIRGSSSLVNDNQPLVVVDGVPIDNTTVGTGGTWGGIDYGSPIGDINPDDIASMVVLKGPSAAALYGSRALNGVIVINTKNAGEGQGKWAVDVGTTWTLETANILKDFQNEYGAGTNGQLKYNDAGIAFFETSRPTTPTFAASWGARMDGQPYVDWNGNLTTYSPQPDNYRDFFQTGYTGTNNVSVARSGKHSGRLSYTHLNNQGITPGSRFRRQNLALNAAFRFKRVSVSAKASYIQQAGQNRVNQSNGDNAARNIIMMPRNVSLESLRAFEDAQGNEQTWYQGWGWMANPYFVTHRNLNFDQRDRLLGNVRVNVELHKNLNLLLRGGQDFFDEFRHQRFAYGSFIVNNGQVSEQEQRFAERNLDFLLTWEGTLSKHISLTASGGGNRMYQRRNTTDLFVAELLDASEYGASNALPEHVNRQEFLAEKRINSLYATAMISYKNWLYAEFTGRNDWASTLPPENNSYFYPSLSLSYVLTDHLVPDSRTLSFAKLRAAVAEVGKDADPYLLQLLYDSVATFADTLTLNAVHNPFPLTNLKPEIKRSVELGTDLRFFTGRINVDFTWYWESTRNQILTSSVSPASGFSSAIVNAGEIRNHGIEVLLRTVNVERKHFTWETTVNFNKNNSLVVALNGGNDREVLGSQWRVDVTATAGLPYGAIWGYGIQRDANGTPLLNADGTYVRTEAPVYLGHVNPDWRMGVTNAFSYRNWSASFLVDIRKGGKLYSATNMYLHGYAGNVTATLEGREAWYASEAARESAGVDAPTYGADGNYITEWDATGGFGVEGVYAPGTVINGEDLSGQAVSRYVNPEDYWSQYANWTNEIHEPFVYDASFVKLREVSVGYRFDLKPERRIRALNCALVARNLWLIYSGVPNVDPEAAYTNGNGQGVEYATYPITRSMGLQLTASF